MNHVLSDSPATHPAEPMPLQNRFVSAALWGALCLLPVMFGAVHAEVYLAAYAIVFLLAGTILYQTSTGTESWLHELPLSTKVFTVFSALLAYLLGNGLVRLFFSQNHPILGQIPLLYSPHEYFNSWISWAASMAMVCLTVYALHFKLITVELILRLVSFSGMVVSLIALSHWFYDNGRLFWIFSPEHIFVSERARWPFVSSNNLGHHLILTLFPTLFLLIRGVRAIFRIIDTLAARRAVGILDLINTPGVQIKMLRIVIDLFTALSISLAILASQSRGSWFGSCMGVIVYLWLDRKLQREHESKHPNESFEILRDRRRKNRPLEGVTFFDTFIFLVRKLSFTIGMILAGVLLLLFLRDRGLDMVLNRAEFGLLSSKDDIRWLMYQNTLPMIFSNPLFGVGLGAWNIAIGQYIDPTLARLNPVYLHSDPLQFLAETGILGVSFVICLFYSVLKPVLSLLFVSTNKDSQKLLCLACSLLSLLIGSFFDFPFRIPSITFLFVVILATLCFIIDSNAQNNGTGLAS